MNPTTTPHEPDRHGRQDDLLAERLHALVESIDVVDPAQEVLRRGRNEVRRRRAIGTAAAGSVLAIGAVAAATALIGPSHSAESPTATAAPSRSVAASKPSPPAATKAVVPERWMTGCPTNKERANLKSDYYKQRDRVLRAFVVHSRALLAEHLDPQGEHLQKESALEQTGGQTSEGPNCVLTGLGHKFGWKAGSQGLGMIQLEVTTDWANANVRLHHEMGEDGGVLWQPAPSVPQGAVRAFVAEYPGGTAVAVTRPDGITVAVDAANLFGNNSVTPVAGTGLTTAQLLSAAADPEFALPN
ncbi:hypothetical protein GCM10009795_005580 [Nocardioides hankookensis]|uniref:Uncharacterized protein n=1 Tax=Nocardioides hankookensis TaxID=443157 RepID=A0ABW1LGX4_9ACTN